MSGYHATRHSEGQSTLEYILIVAIIIVVSMVFLGRNGIFQSALNTTYDSDINFMLNMGERILR